MKNGSLIILTLMQFFISHFAYSQRNCSILFTRTANNYLFASNLDTFKPTAGMWFIPATDSTFGRVCFGIDEKRKIAENGFNEYGLCIDLNSVEKTDWKRDPEKSDWEEWDGWFGTGVPDGILAKCKTVDEAVTVFKTYNLFMFETIKYVLADANGDCAILEWANSEINVIRPKENYYISTNFISSNYPDKKEYTCYRYKIADKILSSVKGTIRKSELRSVLSAVSFDFNTPTQFSFICDLKTLDFSVYFYHNFEEELKINLKEELKKGYQEYQMEDLFEFKSYSYILYKNYFNSIN